MEVDILGVEYAVKVISSNEREKFSDLDDDMDGYCNYYTKEIVVVRDDSDTQGHKMYVNQVIRHELVHAYLFESGLHSYSIDETLVDWIAIQIPKIAKLFEGIEII